MKKTIRLTERDLMRIVERVLSEGDSGDQTQDSFPEYEGRTDIYVDSNIKKDEDNIDTITQQVAEDWYRRKMYRRRLQESQMMDIYPKIRKSQEGMG